MSAIVGCLVIDVVAVVIGQTHTAPLFDITINLHQAYQQKEHRVKKISQHYIDGQWVESLQPGARHDIVNPATEAVIGQLQFGGKADVDSAVSAASKAFSSFSRTSLQERVDLLGAVVSEYEKRMDDLALAVSSEMGAPQRLANSAHVPLGLGHFKTAIALADQIEWQTRKGSTLISREPAGVCALITPWNWPLNQIACKLAPAFLSGCTVVLKPSEYAALSAQIIAEIMDAAGVPAGVFNLIWASGPEVGPHMSSHPLVDLVSLTGSTAAGASVARCAADGIKRVSLELGGKSPNILLEDAPFEKAVKKGVLHLMNNSGQSCNAPSRMLVPASRLAEVEALAVAALDDLTVGDPQDASTTTGPVANGRQFERVQKLIGAGIADGAKLLVGGEGRPDGCDTGYFVKPTIFSVDSNDSRIAREEIFGPVLTLIPYSDEAEAIKIANDTVYGLSGYVYAGSVERAQAVGRQLRAGQVHLNGAGADIQAPFGGFKQSGIGREWGLAGVEEFTEYQAMMGLE